MLNVQAPTSDMTFLTSELRTDGESERIELGPGFLPNSYFLYGRGLACMPKGELAATALAGLFQGQLTSGCDAAKQAGSVFQIQGNALLAVMGAKGSPFMGRWAFTVPW